MEIAMIEMTDWNPILILAILSSSLLGVWISYVLNVRWLIGVCLSVFINMLATASLEAASDRTFDGSYLNYRLHSHEGFEAPVTVVSVIVAANLAIALVIKVYRAVAMQKGTATEMQRGAAGCRAWLLPVNVISVVVIAICLSLGLNYSFMGVSILGILVLLVYPLSGVFYPLPVAEMTIPQAPADERQRVLALVEVGKISAEDGAELLTALAQSQAAEAGASAAISGPRRLMVAGAAAVFFGFFLPWFTINLSQAMHDAVGGLQQNMQQLTPQFSGVVNQGMPNNEMVQMPAPNAIQATLHGGDLGNGLGWALLTAAVVAAGLPFFWTPRGENRMLLRNCTVGALLVGTALLLYLLSNGFNSATTIEPGFLIAIGGYGVLWAGAVREYFPRRGDRGVVMPAVG